MDQVPCSLCSSWAPFPSSSPPICFPKYFLSVKESSFFVVEKTRLPHFLTNLHRLQFGHRAVVQLAHKKGVHFRIEYSFVKRMPKCVGDKEKIMLIYVWNLSPIVSEELFRQTFEVFGQVSFAIISSTNLKDTENGPLRRFAFVEMPDQAEARVAISNLNRKVLLGRRIILYGSSEN